MSSAASAITAEPRPVSVVIPTRDGGPRFQALLGALAAQDLAGGFQLVVIDSGSRDGTPAAARAAGALVLPIEPRDFGHGRTRNRAIERSSGGLIALLVQDALPLGRDYLGSLLAPFADPAVDGAYARQVAQPDCHPLLALRLQRGWTAGEQRRVQALVPGDAAASRQRFAALEPFARYQACFFDDVASALRRSSWERQPLPELAFGEDVAWARAVLLAGGTLCYEPAAQVEHSHGMSIRREFRRLYCDHRNLCALFELRTVTSWSQVWRGGRAQARHYRELLGGLPMSAALRRARQLHAGPYALAEAAAQFLGARICAQERPSRFSAWLDARLAGPG